MPNACSVPNCKSKKGGHLFPLKEPERVQRWLKALRMESYVPKKYSIVCRRHFTEDDYELPKDSVLSDPRLILKRDAVPKIYTGKGSISKVQERTASNSEQDDVESHNISNYHFKEDITQVTIKKEITETPIDSMAKDFVKPQEYIVPDNPEYTKVPETTVNKPNSASDSYATVKPLTSEHAVSNDKRDLNLVICEKALQYFASKFPSYHKPDISPQSPLNALISTLPPDVTIKRTNPNMLFSLDHTYSYSWKSDDNMDIDGDSDFNELYKDVSTQCNLCECSLSSSVQDDGQVIHGENGSRMDKIMDITNPDEVQFYTGFKDFDRFQFMFSLLGVDVKNVHRYNKKNCEDTILSPRDEFLLTVMKLRRNKSFVELGYLFRITKKTVAAIFNSWIDYLFKKFKYISKWMPKDVVRKYLRYGKGKPTIVIVECSGIQLKVKNTDNSDQNCDKYTLVNPTRQLKLYIDLKESGCSRFVSGVFPGSITDSELIKQCSALAESQSDDEDRSETSGQQKKVEKVIGLCKLYTILSGKLDSELLEIASQIIFVCCMLTNFTKEPKSEVYGDNEQCWINQ